MPAYIGTCIHKKTQLSKSDEVSIRCRTEDTNAFCQSKAIQRLALDMQEAIATALDLDITQAVGLAHRTQEDENIQRKLWLAIAHHLIKGANNSDQQPVSNLPLYSKSLALSWHPDFADRSA